MKNVTDLSGEGFTHKLLPIGSQAKLILGTGVDVVEVGRVAQAVRRRGQAFLDRVFSPAELGARRGAGWYRSLAGRFAAKEAVLKAMGTGLRACRWRDVEVRREPSGRPVVVLGGRLAARAREAGIVAFHVSISHSKDYAVAMAIAEGAPGGIQDG